MAEISEDDWSRITDAYRKAYPGQWPDRSMIIDEMVRLYVASITETHEAACVDALASAVAKSPAFQAITGTSDAKEARERIVSDDGSSIEVVRPIGVPYQSSVEPSTIFSNETPDKPGFYWVHNGYTEMVAHIHLAGDGVTLMVNTLPQWGKAVSLRELRKGLRWCQIPRPMIGTDIGPDVEVDGVRLVNTPFSPNRIDKA